MKELYIPSSDGKNQLHVVIWEPNITVIGIVQISHGMIEYIKRYDEFARYLNQYGILVIGNDHLGHGETAKIDDDLGYFCPSNMSETVVADLYEVTRFAKKNYPIKKKYRWLIIIVFLLPRGSLCWMHWC